MTLEETRNAIAAEVAASTATVSVLWQPLDGPALYSHEPQRRVVSASMIKVPILCAALSRVQRGEAQLATKILVTKGYVLEDTYAFETGPREATLEELLTWMHVYSDNTATNVLIDWLGMAEINAFCEGMHLNETRLERHMLDHAAIGRGFNNYTSAADTYALYKALFEDAILTPALCGAARHILHKQRHDKLMRRYLWEDMALAHKTGGLNHLSHDAGVYTLAGRQWFLGVFVENAPDEKGDPQLIGRIARLVVNHHQNQINNATKAVVCARVAPLHTQPAHTAELADEALHGMAVQLLGRPVPGWYHVRTEYNYEGYTPAESLHIGDEAADAWQALPKRCVSAPSLDVMLAPSVQAGCALSVPRGALLSPQGMEADGWQPVLLPGGKTGYVRAAHLAPYKTGWDIAEEKALRAAIVRTALGYLGAQYRWGGKTPDGIDCSGLTAMAYLLNGSIIYRDAAIKAGFDLHEIHPEQVQPADLLFFPGHVAMYVGEGRYVHATGRAGSDGVVLNSLNPEDPLYREDLHKSITAAGSIF